MMRAWPGRLLQGSCCFTPSSPPQNNSRALASCNVLLYSCLWELSFIWKSTANQLLVFFSQSAEWRRLLLPPSPGSSRRFVPLFSVAGSFSYSLVVEVPIASSCVLSSSSTSTCLSPLGALRVSRVAFVISGLACASFLPVYVAPSLRGVSNRRILLCICFELCRVSRRLNSALFPLLFASSVSLCFASFVVWVCLSLRQADPALSHIPVLVVSSLERDHLGESAAATARQAPKGRR